MGLKEELMELYLRERVFRVDDNSYPSDEFLPNAGFKLNFDKIFEEKNLKELSKMFLKAIGEYVYKKREVDVILGIGNSGTALTFGSGLLLDIVKKDEKLSSKLLDKDEFKLKNYRWARIDKSGTIRGEIKDGDRICLIDEVGITYNGMLKWMGYVYGSHKNIKYPIVIVGLDMMLKKENSISYRDYAEEMINENFNRPTEERDEVEIKPIATIEDFLPYEKTPKTLKEKIKEYLNES